MVKHCLPLQPMLWFTKHNIFCSNFCFWKVSKPLFFLHIITSLQSHPHLFARPALVKELHLKLWRVLCRTVILFKQNSFAASFKPHYNHDGPKWTVSGVACCRRRVVTCPVCIVSAHFHFSSISSHCIQLWLRPPTIPHLHTHTMVQTSWLSQRAYFPIGVWQRYLTQQAGPLLLQTYKSVITQRESELYCHKVK